MKARWILPAVCVGLAALVGFAMVPADKADAKGSDLEADKELGCEEKSCP